MITPMLHTSTCGEVVVVVVVVGGGGGGGGGGGKRRRNSMRRRDETRRDEEEKKRDEEEKEGIAVAVAVAVAVHTHLLVVPAALEDLGRHVVIRPARGEGTLAPQLRLRPHAVAWGSSGVVGE